jgi:hypothetical protein
MASFSQRHGRGVRAPPRLARRSGSSVERSVRSRSKKSNVKCSGMGNEHLLHRIEAISAACGSAERNEVNSRGRSCSTGHTEGNHHAVVRRADHRVRGLVVRPWPALGDRSLMQDRFEKNLAATKILGAQSPRGDSRQSSRLSSPCPRKADRGRAALLRATRKSPRSIPRSAAARADRSNIDHGCLDGHAKVISGCGLHLSAEQAHVTRCRRYRSS